MAIMEISKISVLGSNPSAPATTIWYRATHKPQILKLFRKTGINQKSSTLTGFELFWFLAPLPPVWKKTESGRAV